ncbi:Putative SOS response-associated peptidase YedK [Faunimonas pinastri]|uniref:Abasic site processing protein n=1 Tax=Faunimonas pinastri TaxID=1855383 RepID=A0A1H8ZVN2_9HYPH|nr:SOS response-associated peptidase [Faunimonas pinastri]SEP68343.1 Putative SOS response-associated peptidase YedK [Faunimonas pinastri]
MCGRYALVTNMEALRRIFAVEPFDERLVPPRYNIAPTQPISIVALWERRRRLMPVRWGLIPAWSKQPDEMRVLFNARADGITEKPAFRNAIRRRRCLVPASGFYEWQALGIKAGASQKQPFWIRRDDEELVAFAGIWETWCGADGSEIDTAAIVTTDANAALSGIHHRMPVIIAPEDFDAWLSSELDTDAALRLLRPAPDDALSCVPVSARVNAAVNEGPDLWTREEPKIAPASREPVQQSFF